MTVWVSCFLRLPSLSLSVMMKLSLHIGIAEIWEYSVLRKQKQSDDQTGWNLFILKWEHEKCDHPLLSKSRWSWEWFSSSPQFSLPHTLGWSGSRPLDHHWCLCLMMTVSIVGRNTPVMGMSSSCMEGYITFTKVCSSLSCFVCLSIHPSSPTSIRPVRLWVSQAWS